MKQQTTIQNIFRSRIRNLSYCAVLGVLKPLMAVIVMSSSASAATVYAVEDTYITQHAALGGTSSTHGSENVLYIVRGQTSSIVTTIPFVRFDLTSFAGQTVIGMPQLDMVLVSGNVSPTQTIQLYEPAAAWSESTSWDSYANAGFTSPYIDEVTATYNSTTVPVIFDLSASLLQGWIDNPSSNLGLMLVSATSVDATDLLFSSREGSFAPALTFDVEPVPVPAAAWLFGSALGLLSWVRRRTIPIAQARSLKRTEQATGKTKMFSQIEKSLMVICMMLISGSAAAGAIVLTDDGTFNGLDWMVANNPDVGVTANLASTGTGGNPGSQLVFAGNIPQGLIQFGGFAGATVSNPGIGNANVIAPADVGGIVSIDISLDAIYREIPYGLSELAQLNFFVAQDNNGDLGFTLYLMDIGDASSSWATLGSAGLTAGAFDDGSGGNPDFSAAGGDMFFGFSILTGGAWGAAPGDALFDIGIDNYAVTVHTANAVPIPTAAWLFGSALGVLGWVRKRTLS